MGELNEVTHTPEILRQAGIDVPAAEPEEASKRSYTYKADATDGDGDGFVQDGTPFERPVAAAAEPEPQPEPVAAAEPEVVVAAPTQVAAATKRNKGKKSSAAAVVPTELAADTVVLMSKMVFESLFEHNSASVSAVQTRLIELGYITAGDDKLGWISSGTKEALQDYAADNSLEAEKFLDEELIKSLFVGTNVAVLP